MTRVMFRFHLPLLARWLIRRPDLFYPIVQGNVFIMSSIIIYLAQPFQVMKVYLGTNSATAEVKRKLSDVGGNCIGPLLTVTGKNDRY